jgi:NAD(P)-dependent dehydrogenase (short-subunit alcohol dehydrogenase family)
MAKTALITGATGLLGRQVVKAFQHEGWNAVGTGLTRANPPSILKLDVGSEEEITKVLNDVKYAHCSTHYMVQD